MAQVRDKLWIYAMPEHSTDVYLGRALDWGGDRFTCWSRITPAEGAIMLNIPNVIMVSCDGRPTPYSDEAHGYMESFYRMKSVIWSVIGSKGFEIGVEDRFLCSLAKKYDNVIGAFLDDLYCQNIPESEIIDKIKTIRENLNRSEKPLDIWAKCYSMDADRFSAKAYEDIDGVLLCNLDTAKIERMEDDLSAYEKLLPGKKIMLGLHLFDLLSGRPVTVQRMELQCETALRWLRSGRIDGITFLSGNVLGVGFASDYWLSEWIDRVGGIEID